MRSTGRAPTGHQTELWLQDVEFRVQAGGHARMLRTGRRNVHAFAIGQRCGSNCDVGLHRVALIWYDRHHGEFKEVGGGQRSVHRAALVHFCTDGSVVAYNPEEEPCT